MKQDDPNEVLPIVNNEGNVIGKLTLEECHNGSMQIRPMVHLHIYNGHGGLYLQKLPVCKDIHSGKWDTSVGGQITFGEDPETALRREVQKVLGISNLRPDFVTKYVYERSPERELIYVYGTLFEGEIIPSEEVADGKFWSIDNIDKEINIHDNFSSNYKSVLTLNFIREFKMLKGMIDFRADLLRLAHKLLKENMKEEHAVRYEDISREYDKILYGRYGSAMEWLWIKEGTFNKNKKTNTKRLYNRKMIDAVKDIKLYLSANKTPIIEEHKYISKGNEDKKINTDVCYKYPLNLNCDIMDRWVEEQIKNYKGIQKKGLLRLLSKSEGLIDVSWLADDISNQIDSKQRKLISFDSNPDLWNLGLIPTFFRAIEERKVKEIVYNKGYMEEETIIFHPWYLKEFNHRWICFGKKDGYDGEYQVGLERVIDIRDADNVTYIEPSQNYFDTYFDDIIGLSHPRKNGELIPIQHIELEVLNYNAYNRIRTKPIHKTQKMGEWIGDKKDGSARMSIDVRPNRELVGLLLSFGSQIRVLPTETGWLEEEIYYHAKKMVNYYLMVEQ